MITQQQKAMLAAAAEHPGRFLAIFIGALEMCDVDTATYIADNYADNFSDPDMARELAADLVKEVAQFS
jgi:hypothetical protein